jgi:hypothetical protein
VLVSHWPPARTAFETLRDELEPHFPEQEAVVDWLALNETLGADQASLTWFDTVKARPPEWLEYEHRVTDLLVRNERWADLGSLIVEPLEHIARARDLMELMVEDLEEGEERAHLLEYSRERFRQEVSVLIRAMRAAGRHADAEAVQFDARKHDPSEEMRDASA